MSVKFDQLPAIVLQKDKPAYCSGSSAILSLGSFDAVGRTISWLVDGNPVADYAGKTKIEATNSGTYMVVVSDAVGCSVKSVSMAVAFEPVPSISITQIPQPAICDGGTLFLHAVHAAGKVRWSTGQTGDEISVSASGTYRAYITNDTGCEAFAESAVVFDPRPVLAVPDAAICEYTGESVTLAGPLNLKSYEWNGVAGGNTFVIKKSGQVLLHVTDLNGCEASETIIVHAKCADVHIPNTFTPNGDGFNDRWVISGLDSDQSLVVRIFNRYGSKLYEHVGFPEPWDGTKSGSRLPAGVYYYLIKAKNGHDVMSGSLTLLY